MLYHVANLNSQPFSPGLNNQDMKSTFLYIDVPVSDNKAEISSTRFQKLRSLFVCAIFRKSLMRKDNLKQLMVILSEEKTFCIWQAFDRRVTLYRHKLSYLKVSMQHNRDLCSLDIIFSQKCDLLNHTKIHSKSPMMQNWDLLSGEWRLFTKVWFIKTGKYLNDPCDP